jgi:hypothetical protein
MTDQRCMTSAIARRTALTVGPWSIDHFSVVFLIYLLPYKCLLWKYTSRLRKAYQKISKFADVLAYFALKQWKFFNTNTQNLYGELCEADKHIFDFDLSSLDWSDYFYSYVRGIRVYLLKDPLETIPNGLKKHTRLRYLHYFCCTLLSFMLLRLLWSVLAYSIRLFY